MRVGLGVCALCEQGRVEGRVASGWVCHTWTWSAAKLSQLEAGWGSGLPADLELLAALQPQGAGSEAAWGLRASTAVWCVFSAGTAKPGDTGTFRARNRTAVKPTSPDRGRGPEESPGQGFQKLGHPGPHLSCVATRDAQSQLCWDQSPTLQRRWCRWWGVCSKVSTGLLGPRAPIPAGWWRWGFSSELCHISVPFGKCLASCE